MARMTPDEWRKKKEEEKKQGVTSSTATTSASSSTRGASSGRMTPGEWKAKKSGTSFEYWSKASVSLLNEIQDRSTSWSFKDDYSSYSSNLSTVLSQADNWRKQYAGNQEVVSYINSVVNALSDAKSQAFSNYRIFSQYESEDAYNQAAKKAKNDAYFYQKHQGKTYEELNTLLERLNPNLDEYKWIAEYAPTIMTSADYDTAINRTNAEMDKLLGYQDVDRWYSMYTSNPGAWANDPELVKRNLVVMKMIKDEYGEDYNLENEYSAAEKRLWNLENNRKYNFLSDSADFNEVSSNVPTEKTAGFGIGIGESWFGKGDPKYDYINNIENNRLEYMARGMQGGSGNPYAQYDHMTKDEIANYNYLYHKEGKDAADKYLDYLEYALNERKSEKVVQNAQKLANEAPFLASAISIPANLISGTGYLSAWNQKLEQGVTKYFTGEYTGPVDYNTGAFDASRMSSTIRGTVASNIADSTGVIEIDPEKNPLFARLLNGKSLGDVYQLGMSGLDSVASGVAGGGGLFLLGGSAATQGMLNAIEKGATDEQALTIGFYNGAFEMLFEKVSLDNLFKGDVDGIVKTILKQGGFEASEELATSVSNTIADILIMAEKSDFSLLEQEYLDKGLSPEEARKQARLDTCIQYVWDAVGGFASGAGMGLGKVLATSVWNTAVGYHNTQRQYTSDGRAIMKADGANALMDLANEVAGVSDAKVQKDLTKQVNKVSSKMDSNSTSKSTAKKVGKLYDSVKTAYSTQNHADIVKSLERSGFSKSDANQIAGAVIAQANGLELTNKQTKVLESVKDDVRVQNAVKNIVNNEMSTMGQRSQKLEEFRNDIQYRTAVKAITEKTFTPEGKYTVSSKGKTTKLEIEETAEGKTITKDTGETINIKGIKEINKGRMVLELDDGTTIDAKNVAYANKNDALIYEAIANLGDNINAETANKLIAKYDGSDAMVFSRGIAQAYTYGFYGLDRSEMSGKYTLSADLTEEQRNYAYGLGEKYRPVKDQYDKEQAQKRMAESKKAPAEKGVYYRGKDGNATDISTYLKESGITLNDTQKTGIEMMRKMSEMMGVRFNVFESWVENGKRYYLDESGEKVEGNPNGFYDTTTGEIYIDLNAGNDYQGTIVFTVAHELTHFMRQWSPEHFTKIANIVFKHGEMKGNVSELVALKQAKAKAKGKPISYDTAMEEVVADGMETILKNGKVVEFMAEVKQKDHAAWEKIKGWFKNLAKFLRKMIWAYKGQSAQTTEGAKVAEFAENLLRQIEQIWAEGAIVSSENYQVAIGNVKVNNQITMTEDVIDSSNIGISKENKTGIKMQERTEYETMPKQVFSVSTTNGEADSNMLGTNKSVKELRDARFKENGFTAKEISKINGFIKEMADNMAKYRLKYKFVGLQNIHDAKIILNPMTGKIVLSAMVNNSDYSVNFDFTKICKKRVALQEVLETLAREKGKVTDGQVTEVNLSPANIKRINDILASYGVETACLCCFVESKRYNIQNYYQEKVVDVWNKLVDEVAQDAGYFNFADSDVDTSKIPDSEFADLEMQMKEWAGKTGKAKDVEQKMREFLADSPAARKKLRFADLVTANGRTNLHKLYPEIESLILSKLGQSAPKSVEAFTPYNGEIDLLEAKGDGDIVKYLYSIAGVRSQSFSDFMIAHVFDVLQKTASMSARKMPAHVYTKEIARAMLFGMTGEKHNLSVLHNVDENVDSWSAGLSESGEYNFSDYEAYKKGYSDFVQSIGWKDAVALQNTEGYSKDCGIIGVGFSYNHMLKLHNDPEVRQVIGYHTSQMPVEVKPLTHLDKATDYTSVQNTKSFAGFAKPNYAIPEGVPSYATPPQDVMPKGNKKKTPKTTAVSDTFDIVGTFNKLSKGKTGDARTAAAKETLRQLLEYANDNGYVIKTAAGEKGHGDFGLYEDVQKTENPYLTADHYIEYCIERGMLPMFFEFSMNPNYYKDIFDFNVFDRKSYNPETGLHEDSEGRKAYAPQTAVHMLNEDGSLAFPENFFDIVEKQMSNYNSYMQDVGSKMPSIMEEVRAVTNSTSKMSDRDSVKFDDRGYGGIREVLAKNGLDELSKRYGNYFPLSAAFDATMRADETPLVMEKVLAKSVTGNGSSYVVGRKAFTKTYGPKTSVHIKQMGIDADLYADIANESISKAIGKADEQSTLDVIPHIREILENSILMGVERIVHTDKKGTALFGYRLYNLYWYVNGKVKTPHALACTVVQDLNKAEGYVFKNIENVTIDRGLPGTIAGMSSPVNDDTYTVAQLYRTVKKIDRGDGGLNYTAEERRKYLFSYTKRSDGTKYSDRDNVPTFYSQMAKVVDGVKQEKLGAASVVSMLRGKGVKAEEIKWSGIETWLEGKKSVTKAELQEFIAGSMLQIEEEVLDNKDRPYTEDQQNRLDEYEAKRDEVAKRLADEWKKITGEEFPIRNTGAGLESAVVNKIIDANKDHKDASFEGRLLAKLRKDVQKVIENNDDFGFDSWKDALRSIHRHRRDFIPHYEMSTNDKAIIVKYCNALNAYNELPNKISDEDTNRLRVIARETDPWNRKIMDVKNEHNEEEAKFMTNWGQYRLEGGRNYREMLFRIPGSTYTNEAMMTHWKERKGVLAHARVQDLDTFLGKMLFIEEIQSDWHNAGRKDGYRDPSAEDKYTLSQKMNKYTEEFFASPIADVVRERIGAIGYEGSGVSMILNFLLDSQDSMNSTLNTLSRNGASFTESEVSEIAKYAREYEEMYHKWETAPGDLTAPEAPFSDNYHEYVLKRLLREAAEQDYDSIGWTTAETQDDRWQNNMPHKEGTGKSGFLKAYTIEYDQDIPKFLNKYGKKWDTKVGKTVLDNGTEVWSMAITDSMKESVMTEGQALYSERVTDQDTLDFLNKQIENGEYITVYRSFQVIDGGLYAPMNAVDRDENGKNKRLGYRSMLGVWEKATESPEIAQRYMDKHPDAPWAAFDLDGVDNKTGGVAYNPYLHASNLVLNDQFAAAYRRNLVTVECRVPLSEVGAYHAKYAKDTTGWVEWKPGGVAGKLMKVKPEYTRQLFVSRYMLPVRIIPDSEVAQMYKEYLDGTDIQVPWNVVTPSLRKELVKAGVNISYKDVKGSNYTRVFSEIFPDDAAEAVRFQDRDTDSVSNRSLLANAFEGLAQNDIERNKIQEYKGKIDLINAEEQKLRELNEQIKELSFAKGKRDTKKISALRFDALQASNRINTYDKQLLRLEASKPLQDVLAREKKLAYQRAEKKGKEALEKYREKTAKTQRELLERWQESRKKGVDSRHRTAMRHKIKDVVNELNQYLLRGTKDRHVPIELQKAVAEALDAVNMDTVGAEERIAKLQAELMKAKSPEQIQEISRKIDHIREQGERMDEKLKKLKEAYDQFVNSDDPLIAESHDEVISNKLESVIKSVGDTPLRDMTLTQLEDVYDMYRMVLTTIRNANKAFKAKKSESISVIANRVMAEVEKVGGKRKYHLKLLNGIKSFDWNNLKPVYAFERIGSGTLTEVYNNVRNGEDVWAVDTTEAKQFRLAQEKKHNFDSWDFDKRYKFKSTSDMEFELSLQQIMSLYAFSKREQAAEHLRKGGIVFDETTEVTMKSKLGIPLKFNPTEATAYNLSDETLADIVSKLSNEQKVFVDEMQEYLSSVMGAKGNEVSLELYGIKLFKEKFYFPLKSATQFMAKAKEQQQGEVKVKNKGFSKETVQKASNPIVLTPFMDVWADHVNEMSMYHAFVLPMEDFYRVYNYKTPTSEMMATESVEMFIQNAYGKAATKYIDQLLKDLNGGAIADPRESFAKKWTARFKKAKVFSSLSVVIQQPSAIGRAFSVISPKHFRPTKDGMNHKELWNELKTYAPVAVIKEMGYFDTNMGRSAKEFILSNEYKGIKEQVKGLVKDGGYRDEVLSKLPALADEMTWCAIWNAVKRETVATHKDLRPGSEEFLKAAGERFTEVVTKTQVYDSVLARSANMRSKSGLMGMITSFMAEPTTSINMLEDAVLKANRGDKAQAVKIFASVMTSIVLNNALVALVYGMRDDDEDEAYIEKYLSSFVSSMIDDINPITYYPYLKDLWSLFQGYDVERADVSLFSDLADSAKALIKAYSTEDGDVGGAWWDFTGTVANIFGIPLENISRDVNGVVNTIKADRKKTTWGSLGDSLQESAKSSLPVIGWLKGESNTDKLYDAIIKGDTAYADRLKNGYKDDKAYHNAVSKALRENDPRIKEAAIAGYNGDPSERVRISKMIIADGFAQDDVVRAVNAEINAMTPSEASEPKKKGFYTTEDFAREIANGDQASAYAAKTDIIATAQKNGKTAEEAEKSFNSSATSELKDLFLSDDISESKAINALVTYCGKTEDDAIADVQYWAFKQDYPDVYADDAWFDKYYEDVADSGLSIDVYVEYRNQVKDITGEGKKAGRMAVINSLPITSAQKDALYYAEGWAASKLYEAPWH